MLRSKLIFKYPLSLCVSLIFFISNQLAYLISSTFKFWSTSQLPPSQYNRHKWNYVMSSFKTFEELSISLRVKHYSGWQSQRPYMTWLQSPLRHHVLALLSVIKLLQLRCYFLNIQGTFQPQGLALNVFLPGMFLLLSLMACSLASFRFQLKYPLLNEGFSV